MLDEAIAKAKEDEDWQLVEWLRMARGGENAAKWYTTKLDQLKAENTKLRAERDYILANSNPTAAELHRVRSAWKKDRDENAKLREMVRDMFEEIDVYGLDPMYEEEPSWRVGIRELGIEVEDD